MPPADLTQASGRYRAEQVFVATVLIRDLLRMFRTLFSLDRPEHVWPEVRTAVGLLIRDRRAVSAQTAGRYYQRVRAAYGLPSLPDLSGVTDRVAAPSVVAVPAVRPEAPSPELEAPRRAVIVPPRELEAERLDNAVDGAGIATFKKALRSGATSEQARDRASVALSGTAQRLVLEGGRDVVHDTVQADDDMIGWARVTDADPCSWCAMLASRGSVFKSERTAGRAKNDRFIGEGAFKFHDHCGCVAIPIRSNDDPHLVRADELYDQWREATAGLSGRDALNAWRRHWERRGTAAEG